MCDGALVNFNKSTYCYGYHRCHRCCCPARRSLYIPTSFISPDQALYYNYMSKCCTTVIPIDVRFSRALGNLIFKWLENARKIFEKQTSHVQCVRSYITILSHTHTQWKVVWLRSIYFLIYLQNKFEVDGKGKLIRFFVYMCVLKFYLCSARSD